LINLCNEDRKICKDVPHLPCLVLLVESGAKLDKSDIFEELICGSQNRIIEITFLKQTIFEKWTGRIAQIITDFTIDPFTKTSLQNLSEFVWTPPLTLKN
jgi:hypothetical protein